MYEIVIMILILFGLTVVLNILQQREQFQSIQSLHYDPRPHVHALLDPVENVAEYEPSRCSENPEIPCLGQDKIYTYLPYRQQPVESQVFCPPHLLYNTTCYPRPLK